jgi:hypothetical protein
MKTFTVEGWYRLHDDKDFEVETFEAQSIEKAMILFLSMHWLTKFYKIDIKEIV